MNGYRLGAHLLDVVSGIGTTEVAAFGNTASNVQVRFFDAGLSNSAYLFGMSNSRGFWMRDPTGPNGGSFLGIGIQNPQSNLHVIGSGGFSGSLLSSSLFTGAASVGGYSGTAAPANGLIVSGSVGIGTTIPLSNLHVIGNGGFSGSLLATSMFGGRASLGEYSSTAAPTNGLIVSGSVGIGTTIPLSNLHVIGSGGFSGSLLSSSLFSGRASFGEYSSTTAPTNGLIVSGNVGVGTTIPLSNLHVIGSGGFSGSLLSSSLFSGRASLGQYSSTTAPTNGMIISGSVGIGTTIPLSNLHVIGNGGFSGSLLATTIFGGSVSLGQYSSTAAPTNGLIVSGSVGVGTTNPLSNLHVIGSGGFSGSLLSSSLFSGRASLGEYSSTTAPINGMIISGSMGIGTTIPLSNLHVIGNGGFSGSLLGTTIFGGAASLGSYSSIAAPANGLIVSGSVGIGTTNPLSLYKLHVVGNIFATGDVTASSDSNIKRDLVPITGALTKVKDLTGYTFVRCDDPEQRRVVGLIAQDVERVLPEVVYDKGDGNGLSIAYGNLTALLVEAVKDLSTKVEDLYRKNEELARCLGSIQQDR